MFDNLEWRADRMLLNGLVFRLEHFRQDDWELGENCFLFYKVKGLIKQYADLLGSRQQFRPNHILELGIWGGGSAAFWFECFKPAKHVAIDIMKNRDSEYFSRYIKSNGLEDRMKTYWGVDQADSRTLLDIVHQEFGAPLDLVIDDASHSYGPTRTSFETLFPLLRPGGLYVIEDWAWAHWPEFQSPDHRRAKERPLTDFVFELIECIGTRGSPFKSLIVLHGLAAVERGEAGAAGQPGFSLDAHISRRPQPAAPSELRLDGTRRQKKR